MKLNNFQKVIFSLLGLIVVVIGLVVIIKLDSENKYKPYLLWIYIGIMVVVAITLVVYFIMKFLKSQKKPLVIRELVGTERAKAIWIQTFIELTKIPYRIVGDKKIPIRGNAIKIHNCKPLINKRTPNTYYGLDVEVNDGEMCGRHTTFFPLDRGEEGVINNCMMYLEEKTTFSVSKAKPTEWDNVQSHNQLIELERIKAEQSGYDSYDLEDIEKLKISPYVPVQNPRKTTKPKKKDDEDEEYYDDSEEEEETPENFFGAEDYKT